MDMRIGYEMIVGYNHLISNKREWNNNSFNGNDKKILLDLISLCKNNQKTIKWPLFIWHNGSYTMAAKPIKSLELDYTMIQLIWFSLLPQCF